MSKQFQFQVLVKDKKSKARAGIIKTAHGKIETPYLVPVATRGHVISLNEKDIKQLGIQVLLANTYHLHFHPGDKLIKKQGGLHKFMHFSKPIFTDSGGFQAFSLGLGKQTNARKIGFIPGEIPIKNNKSSTYSKITDKGIFFTSTYDDKTKVFMGPKESMAIQSNLGSDIIMAFDECTSAGSSKSYIKEAMLRSHKWAMDSIKYHNKSQALYGIIHGGWFKDLRIKSAKFIKSQKFDGIAIGGSLGKTKQDMYKVLDWTISALSEDKRPRHILGIGWIDDIFECVQRGIDTFDCVEMTRIARHHQLYISPKSGGNKNNKFRIDIAKAIYKNDKSKIDKLCKCTTCKKHTRADIHKMLKSKSDNYARLATIHNVHFMLDLMRQIRENIKAGKFQKLKAEWLS